jgi:hypothetical protein
VVIVLQQLAQRRDHCLLHLFAALGRNHQRRRKRHGLRQFGARWPLFKRNPKLQRSHFKRKLWQFGLHGRLRLANGELVVVHGHLKRAFHGQQYQRYQYSQRLYRLGDGELHQRQPWPKQRGLHRQQPGGYLPDDDGQQYELHRLGASDVNADFGCRLQHLVPGLCHRRLLFVEGSRQFKLPADQRSCAVDPVELVGSVVLRLPT